MTAGDAPPAADQRLKRDIGFLGASMLVLNGVVGAGIFALPGTLLEDFGTFSPYLIPVFGLAILFIALPIGEVASYFDRTGGPVAYTREAFGSFAAFQTGWTYYIARITAFAANATVFAAYAAALYPPLAEGVPRALLIVLLAALITFVNVIGVKRAIAALDAVSLLKFGPLIVLALYGAAVSGFSGAGPIVLPEFTAVEASSLLIFYAFIGFESVIITAGETKNPERTIPRALAINIFAIIAFYFVVQFGYASVMTGEAVDKAPLVAFGEKLFGTAGGLLMVFAALFSVAGNLLVIAASSSRVTFALARDGSLPKWFEWVHPRYATPANSILFLGVATAALALTGSFVFLAVASTLARLFVYLACIASLPVIRKRRGAPARRGVERVLRLVLYWGGVLISLWAISQSTLASWRLLAGLVLLGALLYGLALVLARRKPPPA